MALPTRGVATDAIPRIAIRYDDGQGEAFRGGNQIWAYIDAGIPVLAAINYDNLGTGTYATEAEVLNACQSANGLLMIANHSRTNWNYTLADAVESDFRYELNPQHLKDAFPGYWSGIYINPGGNPTKTFIHANRELVMQLLEEYEYEYAVGVIGRDDATGIGANLGSPYLNRPELAAAPLTASNVRTEPMYRPGIVKHPFEFHDDQTIDLGGVVVPRGAYSTLDTEWLPDPRSGDAPWALGVDNNGLGVEGASTGADEGRTFNFLMAKVLGAGGSRFFAHHGLAVTDATSFNNLSANRGSSGTPATLPGHFSAVHISWTLKRLEELGHLKLVTGKALLDYAYSDYAPGTDLIGNPDMRCPMMELDEAADGVNFRKAPTPNDITPTAGDFANDETRRIDPHYPMVRNMTTSLVGAVAWTEDDGSVSVLNSTGGDLRIDDINGNDIKTYLGKDAAGTFKALGNVIMRPAGTATPIIFENSFGQLPPGKYRLTIPLYPKNAASALLPLQHAIIGTRHYNKPEANFTGASPTETIERKFRWLSVASDTTASVISGTVDILKPLTIDFELPAGGPPMLYEEETVDFASTALGATATPVAVTVTGARVGARVVIGREDGSTVPFENWYITGVVTDNEEVTIYGQNIGGTDPEDPAPMQLWIAVEDLDYVGRNTSTIDTRPVGDWTYYAGWQFQINGGEVETFNHRLTYIGPPSS